MRDDKGREVPGRWQRTDIVDTLRKAGYDELAGEASQTLPESMGFDDVVAYCRAAGISRDELINRMGGSS